MGWKAVVTVFIWRHRNHLPIWAPWLVVERVAQPANLLQTDLKSKEAENGKGL